MTEKLAVFGVATELVAALKADRKRIALVSKDGDYFMLGKSVRDKLTDCGCEVYPLVLDDKARQDVELYPLFEFAVMPELIIGVGGESVLAVTKYFSLKLGIDCICIPTEPSLWTAFPNICRMFQNERRLTVNAAVPEKVIIDLKMLEKSKKRQLADAFSEVASKLSAVFYDIYKFRDYNKKLLSAVDKLCSISEANIFSTIINSQLLLAEAAFDDFDKLFGDETEVGYILSIITGQSESECCYAVNLPLFRLYEAFIRKDFTKSFVVPNYSERIYELSQITKICETDIIKNYSPLEFDKIQAKTRQLRERSGLLELCSALTSRFKFIDEKYRAVYNGRQKRAEFDIKELTKALILAPYLNGNGILKLMCDCGATECLEQI